jgi:RNA polymerase sigma-70 factor (ECF subfamily)
MPVGRTRNAKEGDVLMMASRQKRNRKIQPIEEERLIHRAQQNGKIFGELYERYVRKIYTYIYYRTGNHEDAEDLTSRVFQKAYVHLPRYENQGLPFSAWLYRIAHNIVANWYRDQGRKKVIGLDDTIHYSTEENPDAAAERSAEEEMLLAVVRNLPAERQQILILKFAEGNSNAEIGEIIGRSEGAIKSLYHRTLLVLREEMTKQEIHNERKKGKGKGNGGGQ